MKNLCMLRIQHGKTKSLNLCGKSLLHVPQQLSRMGSALLSLDMKNNQLSDLPNFLANLMKLENLNLGNNDFTELPSVLRCFNQLLKIHLYGNKITDLNPNILCKLQSITFINLNCNQLTYLPSEISTLASLEVLSVNRNKLQSFPPEICSLPNLIELHASHNYIQNLPLEIGHLFTLEKLILPQNCIKELPEGLAKLRRLKILDVAGNELRIFPTEMHTIELLELYCEANPLLAQMPVHSVQEEEILTLKEITARVIMQHVKDKSSIIRQMIPFFPGVREILTQASKCAVCGQAFLNTWLECVKFVKAAEDLSIRKCNTAVIPVRALLCSYKCFNSEGHTFYGVAFP